MRNRPVVIYGDGKQVRDLLYVRDLIDAYDGAIANIGRLLEWLEKDRALFREADSLVVTATA